MTMAEMMSCGNRETPTDRACVLILRAARNESGERSRVSRPVPRFCTGKLTHAARQFSHSRPRGVSLVIAL